MHKSTNTQIHRSMQNTNMQNYLKTWIHKFINFDTQMQSQIKFIITIALQKKVIDRPIFFTKAWPATSNGQIYFSNNWLSKIRMTPVVRKAWLKINCLICVGKTQNHRCLALHRSTKYLCQNTRNLWHRYTDSVYLCILFCVFVFSALLH